MNIKSLILICIIILFSFSSFAKVGDRFNCTLLDAKSIENDTYDETRVIIRDKRPSKMILVTILRNDKAKFEHQYGSQEVPLKLRFEGNYHGYELIFEQTPTDYFFYKSQDKWFLRILRISSNLDLEIVYTKYECMTQK